jgi:hypothetical protein
VRPELLVRPLHPGDARAVQAFVQGLSPQARLNRYFSPIRELTQRQLERITVPRDARDLSVGVFDGERLIAIAWNARLPMREWGQNNIFPLKVSVREMLF